MDASDSSSDDYGMSYLDDEGAGGGEVEEPAGESEPAGTGGQPPRYDSPYQVEGEGVPREYLQFQIKYLTALRRAWTLSMNITMRDPATAAAKDVLRPDPIKFAMSMQVQGFSWEETQNLWNNYSGVSFSQRWGRGDYLAELGREVERLEKELKVSTNNERFTSTELMDWGSHRSWQDGKLESPRNPRKSEADRQIREDQKKIEANEKAREKWFENQQSTVPPGVDPLEALDEALSPIDEPPPGVDPEQALDDVLYPWTAGEELYPVDELQPGVDPVEALDEVLYPVDEPAPGMDPEQALDEVLYPVDEPAPGVDPEAALDEVLSTTLDEVLYPWTADEELYPIDELPQEAETGGQHFTPLPLVEGFRSEAEILKALWDGFHSTNKNAPESDSSVGPASPLPGQSSLLDDDDESEDPGIDESSYSGDGSRGPEGPAEQPGGGSSGRDMDAASEDDSAAGTGTVVDPDSMSSSDGPGAGNEADYGVDYLDEGDEGGDDGVDYLDEGDEGEEYGMSVLDEGEESDDGGMDYLEEGDEGDDGGLDYQDDEDASDMSDDPVAEDVPDDAPVESGE